MSKGIFGFSEKNMKTGAISVAKGTVGIIFGDFIQHKLLHKVPMIGHKFEEHPKLAHLAVAGMGIVAMGSDFLYDAGLCIASNQLAKTIYTVEPVRKFMGYHDPVLSGIAGKISADMINEIAAEVSRYKTETNADRTELSDVIASVD